QNLFFIKTGPGPDATHLTLTAQAAGANLNFHAMIGPFGLFVKDGSASLGGTIQLNLTDRATRHHSQFRLVAFGGSGFSSDLGSFTDFIGASSVCLNPHSDGHGGTACDSTFTLATATLPLYVGTDSFQIPINDPILESVTQAFSNKLVVSVAFGISP